MQHLPLFAQLKDRACLVVGGGPVAERRAVQLLEAGAAVTIRAPTLTETLQALAADGALCHEPRAQEAEGIERYWLIVAATNDREVNARIAAAADSAKRFCNVVDEPALCSFIMPAIVDRDPVTIAIASGGRSPVLSRAIKGLIETALPGRLGSLAELAGRWRERVREALPDSGFRRLFWQHVVTSRVADHSYAGRDRAAERTMRLELDAWQSGRRETRSGEAYLVGAGPGSADLITIRGRQLLAEADVVLYDRLVSSDLLAFARRDAELISVGKTPRKPSITQRQLNRLMVQLVKDGKRVCRLKGGDPMVFGRGGEELEALTEAGLSFQVVPGVSAVEGCAAYAGIPLTLRGVSHAVVLTTGHTHATAEDVLASFHRGQTLALYMGVAQYGEIAADLVARGHDPRTPAAVVESGTTARQRVISTVLGDLPRAQAALDIHAPALLLVGETARFARRYSWFEPGELMLFSADSAPAAARARKTNTKRQVSQ